jgi:predicted Zn-dependent protease
MDEFNSSVKTLYITEKNIEENETDLRGYTTLYGNTIVVKGKKSIMKETIVHEIGHTLGLYHCDDLTCVMAINNDEYDSGDFCNNCKNKLNK